MDTNEDWYLEASIGSESPAPPRVRAPASERLLMSLLGRGMRNISGNTTKLCSRFAVGDFELNYSRTQTTDSTARVTVHLHSDSISDYNELNKWQVFILSKCRGHPRPQTMRIYNILKCQVVQLRMPQKYSHCYCLFYLQFWCAGRSYLSSDQPLLWQ